MEAECEALEPRRLRKFLQALQAGEMSVSRAVEILDAWVHGTYSDDMVPEPPEDSALIVDDEFPMVLLRRMRATQASPSLPPVQVGAQFPFYELRFIMRVLGHEGSAPHQDWQTAYGMARSIFERWHAHVWSADARSANQGEAQ